MKDCGISQPAGTAIPEVVVVKLDKVPKLLPLDGVETPLTGERLFVGILLATSVADEAVGVAVKLISPAPGTLFAGVAAGAAAEEAITLAASVGVESVAALSVAVGLSTSLLGVAVKLINPASEPAEAVAALSVAAAASEAAPSVVVAVAVNSSPLVAVKLINPAPELAVAPDEMKGAVVCTEIAPLSVADAADAVSPVSSPSSALVVASPVGVASKEISEPAPGVTVGTAVEASSLGSVLVIGVPVGVRTVVTEGKVGCAVVAEAVIWLAATHPTS